MSVLRKIRLLVAGFVALIVATAMIAPVAALPNPWSWQDHSELLPNRSGAALSIVSEREGVWLLSDGSHLYRYDGMKVVDLTRSLRDREIYSIANIFSDGRNWLVYSRPQYQPDPVFWLTDGYSWTNVTKSIGANRGDFDAVGSNGEWFLRSFTTKTQYDPAYWTLSRWNGTTDAATPISLPSEVDTRAAGCFRNGAEATLCQGANGLMNIGGRFYLIGGRTEARNLQDRITQAPQASIWQWQNNTWTKLPDLPAFRYVSGMWAGKDTALIATSNTTNPFASDQFWQFDGTTLEEMSDQALSAGLLSIDAREMRAASNSHAWMILVGKRLVQFDGARMTTHGQTRDYFTAISGSTNNTFVLGGGVSEMGTSFMTTPLTAKLVRVEEVAEKKEANAPLTEIFSKVRGPRVIVRAIPQDASIGDGKVFTLRAEATDPEGVLQTHIYVNGARLKSCNGPVCEFTQTFWTNGQNVRTIPLFARAMDKQGFLNDSPTVTLKIDRSSDVTAGSTRLNGTITLPNNIQWTKDTATQTSWTSWRTDANSSLNADKTTTVFVATQNPTGLGRVELWINGEVKRTCDFTSSLDIRICSIELAGKDYPADAEIFANARIFTSKDRDQEITWTTGLRIPRNSSLSGTVNAASTGVGANATRQVVITLDPDGTSVARGKTVIAHVSAQNNVDGINRIEVLVNNELKRACTPGNPVTPTSCDLEIDTNAYPAGTSLSIVAKARDGASQILWSNTRALWIGDSRVQSTSDLSQNNVSVWSWMAPLAAEIHAGERINYSIGAWSANNIQRVDMMVDGNVRKTCTFGNVSGNKECTLTIADTDFADRHVAVINARVTDFAGNKGWSEVHMVKVVREWLPTPESLPSQLTLEQDRSQGYRIGDRVSFVARAWSAANIERIEIIANGQVVANCPGDVCRWTSSALTDAQLEYQARAIDTIGRSIWTGVMGVSQR